jgi:quinoprotein glucose dehydrogenase
LREIARWHNIRLTRMVIARFAAITVSLVCWAGAPDRDWRHYGGDAGGMKYSPLKQIHRGNVARLRVAWTHNTGDVSDGGDFLVRSSFEATPLVVDGTMYVTTPFCRLIALDAETGRELWAFDPKLDRKKLHFSLFANRGTAYWTDGKAARLFFGTLDGRLFSIDARTGKPDPKFGEGGWIDLRAGVADRFPKLSYGMTSPPAVYKDLVICGSRTPDGDPRGPSGDARAFDALSGKLRWRFHVIPRDGEYGADTWQEGSRVDRAAANAWAPLSVDEERGIVFLPLSSPATDSFGGDRKGTNLFGDSLVALNAVTGERIWHFQTVHHNIWDYDLPAQPTLVFVERNGQRIPAVAQVTKMGFTFLFDRYNGTPLFEIEERRVPASQIPGEEAWPTQPAPTKPPPFARQSFRAEELTNVTPESRSYCAKLLENAEIGSLYTPLGMKPTLLFPGADGGANWGGAAFDPETRTLFVNSMDIGRLVRMEHRPNDPRIPYRSRSLGTVDSRFWDPDMQPCQQPPWGHLTAIDLDRGEFRWRSVLGSMEALETKGARGTGTANLGGPIVTAGGLVFIAATNDRQFRAFDKSTGAELWATRLPASGHATPMTYWGKKTRRQYVVVAAGGGNKYNTIHREGAVSDALVAFALP